MTGLPYELVRVRFKDNVGVSRHLPWYLGAPPGQGALSGNQKTLIKHYTDDDMDQIEVLTSEFSSVASLCQSVIALQNTCFLAMSVYDLVYKGRHLIDKYDCEGYATVPIVAEAFEHIPIIKRMLMDTKRDSKGSNLHIFMEEHPEFNLLPDDLFKLLMDRNAPVPALVWTGREIKYVDFRTHTKHLNRGSYMYSFPGIDEYLFPILHHENRRKCIHVFVPEKLPGLVCESGDAVFVDYNNE